MIRSPQNSRELWPLFYHANHYGGDVVVEWDGRIHRYKRVTQMRKEESFVVDFGERSRPYKRGDIITMDGRDSLMIVIKIYRDNWLKRLLRERFGIRKIFRRWIFYKGVRVKPYTWTRSV